MTDKNILTNNAYKLINNSNAEMSTNDHKFILLLLDKYNPVKILEVGVSAGGTSSLILKNTHSGQNLYSVDISQEWYRDKNKNTGFMVDTLCTFDEKKRHTLLTGKDIVERIDEIGGGIDFVLLDTVHILPGELLQFLAVYPYLKKGAVVVVHDFSLNFSLGSPAAVIKNCYATKVLWCSAGSHNKYFPYTEFINIAAFEIDDATSRNIATLFFALGITWQYYPCELIDKYRKFFKRHYSENLIRIFDDCMAGQKRFFC